MFEHPDNENASASEAATTSNGVLRNDIIFMMISFGV